MSVEWKHFKANLTSSALKWFVLNNENTSACHCNPSKKHELGNDH